MINVMFNPKQFPNVRIGISQDYDTLDGPVEFISSNENIIEYDTEQELMDFYANVDFRLFDDLCEIFNKRMNDFDDDVDDDFDYPIEDIVGHFFTIRQVKAFDKKEKIDKNVHVYLDKEKTY